MEDRITSTKMDCWGKYEEKWLSVQFVKATENLIK
jgi:hypothetical protein